MSKIRAYGVLGVVMTTALAFASCGGGGGGVTLPPPGPSPSPSASASPSVSPSASPSASPHPAANGDTFQFSGSSTQTIVRSKPTPTPPPQVTNSLVLLNQTVETGKTFHGQTATDFSSIESDAGPNQTITTTSNNYFVFPSGAGNLVQIGFASTDSNGVSLDVQYLTGNGIVDQLPEVGGGLWSNSAAATIAETDPDGTSTNQNINADGSYSETKTEVAGTTTVSQNPDGTGSLTSPTTVFFGAGTGTKFTIGAQSGGMIPITVSAVGAPVPTPVPISTNVPAWYPAAPTLASDATNDMGSTNMPGGCAASKFGTAGVQLHDARTRLDTVLGYSETETTDTWIVPGAGPACVKLADTVNIYYDETGQSINLSDLLSSTIVQATSLTEIVGLQNETLLAARRHPLDERSAARSLAPQLAVSRERIERFRQAVRQHQLRRLQEMLRRGNFK